MILMSVVNRQNFVRILLSTLNRNLCEDTHEQYEKQNHVRIPMSMSKRKLREDTHERCEHTKLCEDILEHVE